MNLLNQKYNYTSEPFSPIGSRKVFTYTSVQRQTVSGDHISAHEKQVCLHEISTLWYQRVGPSFHQHSFAHIQLQPQYWEQILGFSPASIMATKAKHKQTDLTFLRALLST